MPINHKPSECDAACTREQAAVVVLLATTAGFAVLDAAFGVGDAENGEADINGLVVDEGKVVSAEANAAGDATAANESRGLNAADLKYSKTVQNHLDDLTAATGNSPARMSRPYMDSNAIIQSVMDGSEPGPDDVPGWLRWSTPGMYNNTKGVWQLVVDPE